MMVQRLSPFNIQCDESQLTVSNGQIHIIQHPSCLDIAHLGFSALLLNKISILTFYTQSGRSVSFEYVDKKFRLFPNGQRQYACEIGRWEIEAIDGLIIECMLGIHTKRVSIDTEVANDYRTVDLSFTVSEYFM